MIKKLWRYIIFYYFYFHFIVWKFVKNYLEKPREPTELDKYIEKNKNKLLNSFEEYFTKDMNENIDKVFYDKTTFKELLDNFEKDDTIEKQEFIDLTKSIWRFPTASAKRIGHPAPFPNELPRRCIEFYTFKGDVVLDPFIGSGSTACAAKTTGRSYIGYDISQDYIELAEQRINQLDE